MATRRCGRLPRLQRPLHVLGQRDDGKVGLASDIVTLLHLRLGFCLPAKCVDLVDPLMLQFHKDQEGHRIADRLWIDQGGFRHDRSVSLHIANPALDRGNRQTGLNRDGFQPFARIGLQHAQDYLVGS